MLQIRRTIWNLSAASREAVHHGQDAVDKFTEILPAFSLGACRIRNLPQARD